MTRPGRGTWLLDNAAVLDPVRGELTDERRVLVRDGTIAEVGGRDVGDPDAEVVDLRGATLMPGLIDAHVHVTASTADFGALAERSPSHTALFAARTLRDMLGRGFTSVRDTGGADYGLFDALEEGLVPGPRLFYGGKALSQTGGHGDVRGRGRNNPPTDYCCPDASRVCDGVDECRRAARDELRKGAHHVKMMLGGGITSPTDRIENTQYTVEEIAAVVTEATAARRYVTGHAYTPDAIANGVRAGVRCIEHGNLLDEGSVTLMREAGVFLVPTLATYHALAEEGPRDGLSPAGHAKVFEVLERGLAALELAHRGGVDIVFGTDLVGAMHPRQMTEFALRAQVLAPVDIIRSATVTAARLLGAEGWLGVVAPGAAADLLAVRGNPLDDLSAITDPAARRLLMVRGEPVA